VPWPMLALGMVALIAILTYFDVKVSSAVLGVALVAEVIILIIFDTGVFAHQGNGAVVNAAALNPLLAFHGFPAHNKLVAGAAGIGLFFAFWSWVGFEMAPNYAEESKDPKRIVPLSLYISVVALGVLYTLTCWAAQSGLRAALLGRAGFLGPRTVFEGVHGFFHGFAHTTKGDYDALIGDFGTRWVTETLAFKPYPCGTMTHPYIDCARRLAAKKIRADDVVEIVCEVGEGTVHRLWEPLAAKQKPANGYAGKFSTPYCVATAFVRGNVGLSDFSDAAVRDPAVVALAGKVRYQIDPQNPYPKNFTGHIRATLRDGTVVEERQPYMRGGAQEPLTRADIQDKFLLNATHGGWTAARAAQVLQTIGTLFDGPVELTALRD